MNISISLSKRHFLVGGAIALLAALTALAILGFLRSNSLGADLREVRGQLADSNAELSKLSVDLQKASVGQYGELESAVEVLTASTTDDASKMKQQLKKIAVRLDRYDQCLPELQALASSATGSWYNDGSVTVYPDTNISRYCSDLLYGE